MCMLAPNQNGNGRAELKNGLYASVAESNGNESVGKVRESEKKRENLNIHK